MSGIEVVGLVLAIIPLISESVHAYETSRTILTDYHRFQRELATFSDNIRLQQIILRQLAEDTLASVVDSGVDIRAMLEDPKCDRWKDPAVAEGLKQKLSGEGEYETYCSKMGGIHEQLEKIAKSLEVYKEQVSRDAKYNRRARCAPTDNVLLPRIQQLPTCRTRNFRRNSKSYSFVSKRRS